MKNNASLEDATGRSQTSMLLPEKLQIMNGTLNHPTMRQDGCVPK